MSREAVLISARRQPAAAHQSDRAIERLGRNLASKSASSACRPTPIPTFVAGVAPYPLMFQTATLDPAGELTTSRLLSDCTLLEFVTEPCARCNTGDFGGLWIKSIWLFRPAAGYDGAQRFVDLDQTHRAGYDQRTQA